MTGLVAASNKTMTGIAREVLPASNRALNKFLTEYNWDEEHLNHERLKELQNHGKIRWAQDGYIMLDDTTDEKAEDSVPMSVGSTITLKVTLSGAKNIV